MLKETNLHQNRPVYIKCVTKRRQTCSKNKTHIHQKRSMHSKRDVERTQFTSKEIGIHQMCHNKMPDMFQQKGPYTFKKIYTHQIEML